MLIVRKPNRLSGIFSWRKKITFCFFDEEEIESVDKLRRCQIVLESRRNLNLRVRENHQWKTLEVRWKLSRRAVANTKDFRRKNLSEKWDFSLINSKSECWTNPADSEHQNTCNQPFDVDPNYLEKQLESIFSAFEVVLNEEKTRVLAGNSSDDVEVQRFTKFRFFYRESSEFLIESIFFSVLSTIDQ